jgi:hypothetical protein
MPPQAKSSSMQVTNEERRWLLERRRFHKNQRDLEHLLKRDSALRAVLKTLDSNGNGNGVAPDLAEPTVKRRRRKRRAKTTTKTA